MTERPTDQTRHPSPTLRSVLGRPERPEPPPASLLRSACVGLVAGVVVWILAAGVGFELGLTAVWW